jgi:hypothetical protein
MRSGEEGDYKDLILAGRSFVVLIGLFDVI